MADHAPDTPLAKEMVSLAPGAMLMVIKGVLAFTQLPRGPQITKMRSSPALLVNVLV